MNRARPLFLTLPLLALAPLALAQDVGGDIDIGVPPVGDVGPVDVDPVDTDPVDVNPVDVDPVDVDPVDLGTVNAPGVEPLGEAGEDYLLDDEAWWESVVLGEDDVLDEDENITTETEVEVGVERGTETGVGGGEFLGEDPLLGDEMRLDVTVPDADVDIVEEEEPEPLQMGPMDLLTPTGEPLRIGPPTAPGPGGILR